MQANYQRRRFNTTSLNHPVRLFPGNQIVDVEDEPETKQESKDENSQSSQEAPESIGEEEPGFRPLVRDPNSGPDGGGSVRGNSNLESQSDCPGMPAAQPVENPVTDPGAVDGHLAQSATGRPDGHLTGSSLNTEVTISNARQIPAAQPVENLVTDPGAVDGLMIPKVDFDQFDQSTGWNELWRLEKDGNNYRWRLRFVTQRVSRSAGKLTAKLARKLKDRPGKGRHQASRQDAARLQRRAESASVSLRASAERRAEGQKLSAGNKGRTAGSNDPVVQHEQVPGLQGLAQRNGMSGLSVDEWPEEIELKA